MVKTKKNLLIISPVIPNPNISAGDYRVYTLTKELKKYFNIFFMPLNYNNTVPEDFANFNKITSKIVKPVLSAAKFSQFVKQNNISISLFEKYLSMPFNIYNLMSLTQVSVIDTHEIGFVKSAAQSKICKINNTKLFKAKELIFYKNANMLIAITEKEKSELQKYFPDKQIIVIPTCTTIKNNNSKTFKQRLDICYFGFFKHQPNTDAINYFIKNMFPKLKKQIPNIKFYILGYGSREFKNSKDIISVDNIKNIPNELSKYKVFVCPLRYGAGLKKKVLDAMAAKTPVVSTSFGVEGIKNIESDYFDIKDKAFIKQIVNLYNNKKIWSKISQRNFNIVKKYYSIKAFKQYVKHFVDKVNQVN